MRLQRAIFDLFERRGAIARHSRFLYAFLGLAIVASTALSIWETVPENDVATSRVLSFFQDFFGLVFLAEYLARLWIAPLQLPGESAARSRVRVFLRPMMVIDLLVILPFVLPYMFSLDITVLRIFRLVRVLRIARFGRFSKSMNMVAGVLQKSMPELVVSLALSFGLLVIAATGIYHFEREAQPQVFVSIPQSIWWAVNALTGIWYGDVYPVTFGGKAFAAMISLLGVGTIALPAGILATGIMEAVEKAKKPSAPELCPHCQEPIFEDRKAS
jgi:voltage-gated potassium channel